MKKETKKETAVRLSAKQKLTQYKHDALTFINILKRPAQQLAFSVSGYQKTEGGGKKPNVLSAPELLAIVGTAAKLGKQVHVSISGVDDGGQLNFYFVDAPPATPMAVAL
jgi:hypothetical protein